MTFSEFEEHVLCGREIEFVCRGEAFFIGNGVNDTYISNENSKNVQYFKTRIDLVQSAKVFEHSLKNIWNEIKVEYVL